MQAKSIEPTNVAAPTKMNHGANDVSWRLKSIRPAKSEGALRADHVGAAALGNNISGACARGKSETDSGYQVAHLGSARAG